jgi:hypothetical protein
MAAACNSILLRRSRYFCTGEGPSISEGQELSLGPSLLSILAGIFARKRKLQGVCAAYRDVADSEWNCDQ